MIVMNRSRFAASALFSRSRIFAAVSSDRLHVRPPGGESLLDYKARVLPVLDRLRGESWRNLLVIAHEETLRVLVAGLKDLDDTAMPALEFANCEPLAFALSG